MTKNSLVFGITLFFTLATVACEGPGEGSTDEQLSSLQTRLEGLEATLARSGPMAPAASGVSFPDTLLCGDVQSYADSVARSYTVANDCEFSAYVQVFDSDGDFVRQEKISGYDSGTVSVGAFESVEVRCTWVQSLRGRCVVTRR